MSDMSFSSGDEANNKGKGKNRDEHDVPASEPINTSGHGRGRGATIPNSHSDFGEGLTRDECFGYPPKKHMFPPNFGQSSSQAPVRRSTLADEPELDHQLRKTMVHFEGVNYVPMSSAALNCLSPFWKGLKPIANYNIFEHILINKDINKVHADHVVAALERIGSHCKHLLVVSPIHTAELGDVFKRQLEDCSNTGNDWSQIFKCFPNLESATFKHPLEEPTDLMIHTFKSFQRALAAAGYPSTFKVNVSGPPELMKIL